MQVVSTKPRKHVLAFDSAAQMQEWEDALLCGGRTVSVAAGPSRQSAVEQEREQRARRRREVYKLEKSIESDGLVPTLAGTAAAVLDHTAVRPANLILYGVSVQKCFLFEQEKAGWARKVGTLGKNPPI